MLGGNPGCLGDPCSLVKVKKDRPCEVILLFFGQCKDNLILFSGSCVVWTLTVCVKKTPCACVCARMRACVCVCVRACVRAALSGVRKQWGIFGSVFWGPCARSGVDRIY